MEAGSWDSAASSFSDALHSSRGDAKGRAAQYLAAVKLCKVWAGSSSVQQLTALNSTCTANDCAAGNEPALLLPHALIPAASLDQCLRSWLQGIQQPGAPKTVTRLPH